MAGEVKAMLQQRLMRETTEKPSLYDSLYIRLADECDRWSGEEA